MAQFGKIYYSFWDDPEIQRLSPDEKLLLAYLYTNRRKTVSGIFEITPLTIANETGLTEDFIAERLATGFYRNVLYDVEKSTVFVKNLRARNMGGAPENIRKVIATERQHTPTPLWSEFDKLYDIYGQPLSNGCGTVQERFFNSNSNSKDNKSNNNGKTMAAIVLNDYQDQALKEWLRVPGFKEAKYENLANQVITLTTDPVLKAVDYIELAKTAFAWATDNDFTAKNPSLFMRNFAVKAVEKGTDLRPAENAAEPPVVSRREFPEPPAEDKEIWRAVLAAIAADVEAKEFDTWLQPMRLVSIADTEIVVAVPNGFYKDFINENYLPLFNEKGSNMLGRKVEIRLIETVSQVEHFE